MNCGMSSILRGGRLRATRKDVVEFISSVQDDKRIAHATVLVNEAHVIALAKAKAISRKDSRKLLRALRRLERGLPLRKGVEDVHVLIEEYVTKQVGREVGGQLHLAKSRNDQVVTAIRMVLREELLQLSDELLGLERQLLRLARRHIQSVFPGYTHLQPAQPISFAHYLIAIGDAYLRDNERLFEAYGRVNRSPMGAGALAGSSFNLDRQLEAELLGFDGLVENTLDAVGSRDFALEPLSVLSITAIDVSRLAQDLIFYSSADVGLITIPDEFTSTSSIMPQKKNPDPLELIRAKCARVTGNYGTAATMVHSLPSGYNLDFQEITPLLWNSFDTLKPCLRMLAQLVPGIKLDRAIARRGYLQYLAATEIANTLVREEHIPFRTAHRAVGYIVRNAMKQGKILSELTPAEWERGVGRKLKKNTFASVTKTLDFSTHITHYHSKGSPNPRQVETMIRFRTARIQSMLKQNEHARTKR